MWPARIGSQGQVVAPASFELRRETRGPIDAAEFPTVGLNHLPCSTNQRPGIRDDGIDDRVPVPAQGVSVEVIDHQAVPRAAGGRNIGAVVGVAEPQDHPCAVRRVPAERAVPAELVGQVEHVLREHVFFTWGGGDVCEQRCAIRRAFAEFAEGGFLRQVLDWPRMGASRILRLTPRAGSDRCWRWLGRSAGFEAVGQHERVAVESLTCRRLGQYDGPPRWTLQAELRPGDQFGGPLRGDHGAAQVPAALQVQPDLQSQPVGFAKCVAEQGTPWRRAEQRSRRHGRVSALGRPARVEHQGAAHADGLHPF